MPSILPAEKHRRRKERNRQQQPCVLRPAPRSPPFSPRATAPAPPRVSVVVLVLRIGMAVLGRLVPPWDRLDGVGFALDEIARGEAARGPPAGRQREGGRVVVGSPVGPVAAGHSGRRRGCLSRCLSVCSGRWRLSSLSTRRWEDARSSGLNGVTNEGAKRDGGTVRSERVE